MATDRISDKVVIVTGASSGIGLATAHAFSERGAHVVLAARNGERLAAAALEIHRAGGNALAVPCDVTRDDQVQNLVAETLARHGRIDVLINNAGVGLYARIMDLTPSALDEVMQVNLHGCLRTIQAVVPPMRSQGSGVIVNVSSVLGKVVLPQTGGYCATKFALNAMTAALRMELRGDGIDVLLVCPGMTATEFRQNSRVPEGQPRPAPSARAHSAESVGLAIVRATEQRTREVILTAEGRAMVGLARIAPGLVEALTGRMLPDGFNDNEQ